MEGTTMKKLFLYLLPVAALLFFFSCQQVPTEPEKQTNEPALFSIGDVTTITLYAGQNIDVGEVQVWNDEQNLYVKYIVDAPDWCLEETHVALAYTLEGIPQKNGNPIPGQFPYKHEELGCVPEDLYTILLIDINPSWLCGDELYIATHAVVQTQNVECIDFESFSEFDPVSNFSTDAGDVNFYMVSSSGLNSLVVGDVANLDPIEATFPIVGAPNTSPPYANIAGFTVGSSLIDDWVSDDNGTGAAGNNLTDPQDKSQTELLWHAYSQNQAIVIDVSTINNFASIELAIIDLDHNENWTIQFFDAANTLLDQVTLNEAYFGLAPYEGDGVAFPAGTNNSNVSKVVIWGGNNLGISERVGYAIDNICITTVEEETAWGDGPGFPGNNWATYFNYTIECEGPTPGEGCETAFAYGGSNATCFLDLDASIGTFHRWGWTNGPLSAIATPYTFDIYAGAGQCDLGKGELVGTLTVVYDGTTATVTFLMASGFTMDETHLYVGSEILPRDVNGDFTVAPGQYPDQHDLTNATTDSYTITSLSGDIYVIAHAVVCSP